MEGFLRIILIGVCMLYIKAQGYHEYGLIVECGGSDEGEWIFQFENEQVLHVDFKEQKNVMTLPEFVSQIEFPPQYGDAIRGTVFCKSLLDVYSKHYANLSEPLEPPWSSIYPKHDLQINVENTLICHVTRFFPPPVRILWTKNDVKLTDGSTLSKFYPNKDGTLNVFSQLSFIPEEGDIYSCSVEHKALEQPQTRTWDVEINEPSIGPSVFCGVGLTLGLLGFATGVFFVAKGNNCN